MISRCPVLISPCSFSAASPCEMVTRETPSKSASCCSDPVCERVCPAGAYTRRQDGLVVHAPSVCMGSRYCTFACPYAAPQYNEKAGKVCRCSGCHDRVDQGLNPACVDACIVRAIEFGPLEEVERRHPEAVQSIPVLPDPKQTNPSIRIQPRAEVTIRPPRVVDGQRARQLSEVRKRA